MSQSLKKRLERLEAAFLFKRTSEEEKVSPVFFCSHVGNDGISRDYATGIPNADRKGTPGAPSAIFQVFGDVRLTETL